VPVIFISYRRDDTRGYAGRLYDRIVREFGRDNVFIDVHALKPGDDFVDAIRAKLEKCHVMLALIGKRWLTAADDQGRSRLKDGDDYVRLEIETALNRQLLTIPVLLERTPMPRLRDLPQRLRPLARREAIELTDTGWESDVGRLVEHLKRIGPAEQGSETTDIRAEKGETSSAVEAYRSLSDWLSTCYRDALDGDLDRFPANDAEYHTWLGHEASWFKSIEVILDDPAVTAYDRDQFILVGDRDIGEDRDRRYPEVAITRVRLARLKQLADRFTQLSRRGNTRRGES
jgi:hypothetical protein